MRRKNWCGLVILLVTGVFRVSAESNVSFVVAPPPVGHPELVVGTRDVHVGVGGVYAAVTGFGGGDDLHLYGVTPYLTMQEVFGPRFALYGGIGAAFMIGDVMDLAMMQVPLLVNAIFQPVRTGTVSVEIFGGAGGSIGVTVMTVPLGFEVPPPIYWRDDDARATTLTTMGNITGGAQAGVRVRPFIFSVFGSAGVHGGTFSTEYRSSMSEQYDPESGSIPNTTVVVVGVDVLHTPSGVALSSFFQRSEDFTFVTAGLRWKWGQSPFKPSGR